MPSIGPLEILVVGVLALIVFGPQKLPEMARSLGKGLSQLKQMANDVKSEFEMSDLEESVRAPEDRPEPKVDESALAAER